MANDTTEQDVQTDAGLTGKDLFMAGNVLDELNGSFETVEAEGSVETPQDEAEVEEVLVTPEVELDEAEDEDSDDDILADLLGEDETDGEADDATEDDLDIADKDSKYTVKVDGEELEVTLDELKRSFGQQKSLTKKEMDVADKVKQLDEKENTLDYLKYQGEFAPEYHKLNSQSKALEGAKDALAKGEAYNGQSGSDLSQSIMTADVIITKGYKDLEAKRNEAMHSLEAPGRKALEAKLPDIADKFNDYAKDWYTVGSEFGYTDAELGANSDFRFYSLLQEVKEGRAYKATIKAKLDKVRAKRGGKKVATKGSPKKANPGQSKKVDSGSSIDYSKVRQQIADGSLRPGDFMDDLLS